MASRTRIRWTNVVKLAAGAIGCAALVVGLPALLKRPEPPPLPSDVGLAPVSDAPAARAFRATRVPHSRHEHAHAAKSRRETRPSPHHHEAHESAHHGRSVRPHHRNAAEEPASASSTVAATLPAPSPPDPGPAHTPPPPVPAAAPAPPPAPVSSAPAPPPPPGDSGQSSAPSEFGFER